MQAEKIDSSGAAVASPDSDEGNITRTRRALLGALVAAPLAIGAVSVAQAEPAAPKGRELYERGYTTGSELALCGVARVWVDRWRAAGGDIGLAWNADGSFRGIALSMFEPGYWQPTDAAAGKLAPHLQLREPEHQAGAAKVLEAMIDMVPGLRAEVALIAGRQAMQKFAEAQS